jgi:GT2 family glycosyltransferase
LSIGFIFDYFHKVWTGYNAFRGTNFAVRRNILIKCGGFDPKIRTHGDVELSSRISMFGNIIYNPNLIVQTTDRHIRNPKNFLKFLIRMAKAVYYIDIMKEPRKINRMFDIR